MGTLTNYEGLLALSTSPHLSQAMRGYLVGVLAEHRELVAALRDVYGKYVVEMHGEQVCDCDTHVPICAPCLARAALARAEGKS